MKNVHVPGVTSVTSADNSDDQKAAMDQSDDESTVADAERFQKDVASCSTDAVPLIKHRRTQGGDADQAMAEYRCIICGYSGYSVGALARHRLCHSAWSMPYRCAQCSHRATTRRLLTKHVMIQHRRLHADDCTTGRQVRCSYTNCPFTCHDRDQLMSHGRQHAAAGRRRQHACDRCSFAVDSRNALLHHRRLHH